jgi:hypothetical protein
MQAWIRRFILPGAELFMEIIPFCQNKFASTVQFPLDSALRPLQKSLAPQRGASQ